MRGTTTRTVDVTISIPRELWFAVGDTLDHGELREEYSADAVAGNSPDEEWLLRSCLLPYLAREAGLDPDSGELVINPTGEVTVSRERADDGTFSGENE